MYMFDEHVVKSQIVNWIREWFDKNGKGCNAVIGISGGKDSSIVAALCCEALGKDRVIGVLMPQGVQPDIEDARKVVDYLRIKHYEVNISDGVKNTLRWMEYVNITPTEQTKINLPPRERLKTLRAIAQSMNGRVANTCNLSEDWVGYSTVDGDNRGDFSPLSDLTQTEVKQIGHALELPCYSVEKIPSDGLCGKTDEDNLGFTYDILDKYIRYGTCHDMLLRRKIDSLHEKNSFKLKKMDKFEFDPEYNIDKISLELLTPKDILRMSNPDELFGKDIILTELQSIYLYMQNEWKEKRKDAPLIGLAMTHILMLKRNYEHKIKIEMLL